MKKQILLAAILIGLALLIGPKVSAQYTSSNYKTNEVFFGSGGDPNQSSSNYKAQADLGALGVGWYSSSNYQIYSGFLTPNEPFLEMQIDTAGPVNLGNLSTLSPATGTAAFHVRAYTNSGYTVQIMSQPPSYTSGAASHTLTGMSTLGISQPNTEQFGINLVHNTSPASFGTDPSPQPDSTFATQNNIATGTAAAGYGTQNQYKYVVGDTIAQTGTSGWGQTNFTIAYIANISNATPAGNYSMIQDLVVVATF